MNRRVEYVEDGGYAVEQRGRLADDTAAIVIGADGIELVFDGDPLELLGAIGLAIQRAEPGMRAAALLRARMALAVGGYERPADVDDDPTGCRDLVTDAAHLIEHGAPVALTGDRSGALWWTLGQLSAAGSTFEDEREEWAGEDAAE